MNFGDMPDLQEGDEFSGQSELYQLRFHGDRQQGIHGSSKEGAESVVLAGGYEDDQDRGDTIIYTGMTPGTWDRQNRTTKADQELSGKNLALAKNIELGIPVRVFRSSKHDSPWSPETGVRYAGLYSVTHVWHSVSKSGHLIYQFRLQKLKAMMVREGPPSRSYGSTSWISRDQSLVLSLKRLYKFKCQVCGTCLDLPTGPYIEVCHIRPLGEPHNGPDNMSNMLCLCPNHHVLFDSGAFTITVNGELIGIAGKIRIVRGHDIASHHLAFHREHIYSGG